MIAKQRFGVPAEDFGKVRILNRNYPLIKTSPSDEVSKTLMQPISTIKNLIERGELTSFSGWVQKCFINLTICRRSRAINSKSKI